MRERLPDTSAIHWLLLVLLLCGGGFLRYSYMHGTEVINPGGAGDAGYYLRYANNLVQHAVFSKQASTTTPAPDAYWAPGYPALLAALIASAEGAGVDAYLTIRTVQITLGTTAILFTFALGICFMPAPWALLAALLVALSPHLVSTEQYLLSETLTLFLLLASLLLFVRGIQRRSTLLQCGAGIGFALTYLTNPVSLFIAPVAVAVTWLAGPRGPDGERMLTRRAALMILGPLLVAGALWTLRGALSVPADSPTAGSRLLTNLVQGMHADFHSAWRANPRDPDNPATVDLALVDGSYPRFAARLADKFAADPTGMLHWYLLEKPLLLWDWDIRVGAGDIYTYPIFYSLYQTSKPALATYVVMRSVHLWLVAFGVLSLVFLIRHRTAQHWVPLVLYACLAYVSAVYAITQAEPRYSFPLRPEMYLMAAFFLWRLAQVYLNYRERYRGAARPGAS
tara:strand:- start:39842 stop:41203 length:1362 start_codon:yes stop_codon:yes gene_type:complete